MGREWNWTEIMKATQCAIDAARTCIDLASEARNVTQTTVRTWSNGKRKRLTTAAGSVQHGVLTRFKGVPIR